MQAWYIESTCVELRKAHLLLGACGEIMAPAWCLSQILHARVELQPICTNMSQQSGDRACKHTLYSLPILQTLLWHA